MSDNSAYVTSLEASIAKLVEALKRIRDADDHKAWREIARQAVEDQEGCGA